VPDTTTLVPAPTAAWSDPASPWRDATVTAHCQHCRAAFPAGGPRRYCSNRCRQAAYRRRGQVSPTPPPTPPAGRSRTEVGVYECPGCGERMAGQRRCPDCQLFARRIGDGGCCTSCGEVLTTDELLNPT